MKKSDLNKLEKSLLSLPFYQKKFLVKWLSGQINSDINTLIDTEKLESPCPHCMGVKSVKWGFSSGLQRYKCQNSDCKKTFNALTNTPLARMRYHEKWLDYLSCMLDSLTLRETAKRLNINLKTSFYWRHRFLQSASLSNSNLLTGIVEVDETFFLESQKGKRKITDRKPRKRGGEGNKKLKSDKVSVVIARDRNGHVSDTVPERLAKNKIHEFLKPIVDSESILCSDGASWYKSFAIDQGIAHHRLITLDNKRVIGKEFHIQNVNGYISRLKGWMTRFHGVGTSYLPNYLAWKRLFETANTDVETWLRLAIRANQQSIPT